MWCPSAPLMLGTRWMWLEDGRCVRQQPGAEPPAQWREPPPWDEYDDEDYDPEME